MYRVRKGAGALYTAVVCAAALTGCFGDDDPPPATMTPECVSLQEYFAKEIFTPILSRKCMSCHGPGGRAEQENAKLQLVPPTYPGFLEANLANVRMVAGISIDGTSELLLKPTGQVAHGVEHQGIEPGAEPPLAPEGADGGRQSHADVLCDVFRIDAVARPLPCGGMYEVVIHLDQLSEGLGIAAARLPDEFGFQVTPL